MVGWLDILGTAFVLQLLALHGEKGQLVIAALATKYDPYVAVAGAATAFGGWTVLEILLGNALKGGLPEVFLDGLTAVLFFIFAAWILYTSQLDFDILREFYAERGGPMDHSSSTTTEPFIPSERWGSQWYRAIPSSSKVWVYSMSSPSSASPELNS